jgi:hypothetical protein
MAHAIILLRSGTFRPFHVSNGPRGTLELIMTENSPKCQFAILRYDDFSEGTQSGCSRERQIVWRTEHSCWRPLGRMNSAPTSTKFIPGF